MGAVRRAAVDTLGMRRQAWEQHVRGGAPPVLAEELEGHMLGQWAKHELKEVRKALALTPAGFEPYRHTMMIEGRPVQAHTPREHA